MLKIKFTSVLLMILFLFAVFSGCSPQRNEPNNENSESAAEECLSATLSEAYLSDAAETSASMVSKQIYNMTTYRVIDSENEFYEVEITYPNLGAFLFSSNSDNIDFETEDFAKIILFILESDDLEMTTETIRVELVDGKPEINDALTNAYSGGLLSALTDVIDKEMTNHIEVVING